MAEMIIPGTYIAVRAEGLISAGRVATGIVGVVGTAARGPTGTPITLAGFAEAREIFGLPDDFNRPENGANPLTLVRALEHIYSNGASTVVAVRVAGDSKSSASYAVQDSSEQTVAVLTARTPGSWGNSIRVEVEAAEDECRVDDETHSSGFDSLNYARVVPSAENRIRVFRGITKRTKTLDIVYKRIIQDEEVVPVAASFQLAHAPIEDIGSVNLIRIEGETPREYGLGDILYDSGAAPAEGEVNVDTTSGELTFDTAPAAGESVIATYASSHPGPTSGQVLISTWDGSLDFATDKAPDPANGDRLIASYLVDRQDCVKVTLAYEAAIEAFTVPDGNLLAQRVSASSVLAAAEAHETHGGGRPAPDVSAYFGTGSNTPGSNGAEAGRDDYAIGLESLANQLINIVVLAGQDAGTMASVLEGHLNATEQVDYERIGVIGAPGDTLAQHLGHAVASDRIVVVAPGLAFPDGAELPAAYTAAAVAGLISSLAVQTSLTNKTLTLPGLAQNFNRGQQAQLIKRNVLSLVLKNGYRVLKGITTEGEGAPFAAIPTRRIVDYAKYGVRSAANLYIGRLNNSRVRAALQATLEAFLTRMVEDEALTGFELGVSATRAQEIAGEVSVVMTLQPTFSIDFIRVTMNLK